jgi:hypothetical protein
LKLHPLSELIEGDGHSGQGFRGRAVFGLVRDLFGMPGTRTIFKQDFYPTPPGIASATTTLSAVKRPGCAQSHDLQFPRQRSE